MNTGSSKRKERWNRPSATLPVRWKLFSDKSTSGSIEPVQENNCHELERLQPSPLTVHSPFRASPSETKSSADKILSAALVATHSPCDLPSDDSNATTRGRQHLKQARDQLLLLHVYGSGMRKQEQRVHRRAAR